MKPNEIKILIVDDEPELLDGLTQLFRKFGFWVGSAASGDEAWQILKDDNSFQLVLTDVRMPNGDGIELAKKIRAKHPSKPSLLFMSGFSNLLNEEIFHIGAEGKFTKPFDNEAVKKAIETCMLVPHLRWNKKPPLEARRIHIDIKAESVQQLESEKKVIFARGGMFLAYDKSPPEKETIITFKINITSEELIFSGYGFVAWSHTRASSAAPAGIGLGITYLPDHQAAKYHEMFGAVPHFIPSPYKKL